MRPKKIYITEAACYTITALGKKLTTVRTRPDKKLKNAEYTDLSQLWHDSAEPIEDTKGVFLIMGKKGVEARVAWFDGTSFRSMCCGHAYELSSVSKWAYIKDLIPKG